MNAAEFLLSLGDDAEKWAKAFVKCFSDETLDENSIRGWFADAVEHSYDMYMKYFINDIQGYIDERIKQHKNNLELWENGFLAPTEPDESERNAVKRELRAAISELEKIKEKLT